MARVDGAKAREGAYVLKRLACFAGSWRWPSRHYSCSPAPISVQAWAFLFSVPVLPFLLLCAVAATVWATCIKVERSRATIALLLICLTRLAYLCSYAMVQTVRFLLWHTCALSPIDAGVGERRFITGWDSWGMAVRTPSSLVVDTQDRLGSKARAAQWAKHIGQSCGLWQTQRTWPRLTYTDCSYDGVQPAG